MVKSRRTPRRRVVRIRRGRGARRRQGHRVHGGSRGHRPRGRWRQSHRRSAGKGVSGSASLKRSRASSSSSTPRTCSSSSAASSRWAGCRRSSPRAGTRKSSRARLSGRVAERAHSRRADRRDYPRDGGRPSAGQSPLLARSGQRAPDCGRRAEEADRDRRGERRLFRAALRGVRPAADEAERRWKAALAPYKG